MTATERSAKPRTPPTTPATTGTIDVVCDEEDDGVEAGVAVGSESVVDSGPSNTLFSRQNGAIGQGRT